MKKFEYTFTALGTVCTLSVIAESDAWLIKVINNSYALIENFENEFSRFRETSVLSKLNREKKQEISDDFLTLVYKSRDIYKMTDGYFNPLVDVRKIGYSHSFTDGKFEKIDIEEDLNFDEVKNYGSLLEIGENMNLDFGSIAKWYLAEKISHYIASKWYKKNLCNMWGDIYASGTNLEWEKWSIGIVSPFWNPEPITTVQISDESISTSGTYLRNWELEGKKYHHIRNPFSEKSQEELVSVSIFHKNGYMTDAIATAVIAMWREKAENFCKKNGIKYLFVLKNGDIIQ